MMWWAEGRGERALLRAEAATAEAATAEAAAAEAATAVTVLAARATEDEGSALAAPTEAAEKVVAVPDCLPRSLYCIWSVAPRKSPCQANMHSCHTSR